MAVKVFGCEIGSFVGGTSRTEVQWEAFIAIYNWFGRLQLLKLHLAYIHKPKSILILFEMKEISGRHIGEMLKEARENKTKANSEQLAQNWVRKGVTFLRSKLIMAIISNFKPLKR